VEVGKPIRGSPPCSTTSSMVLGTAQYPQALGMPDSMAEHADQGLAIGMATLIMPRSSSLRARVREVSYSVA